MKKINLLCIGLIGFLLIPFEAKAATVTSTISCDKTTVEAGNTITCTLKAESDVDISALGGKVVLGDNLEMISVDRSDNWYGDKDDLDLEYAFDEDLRGNFDIAIVKINTADVDEDVETSISVSDLILYGGDFITEYNPTVSPVSIKILPKEGRISDKNPKINNFEFSGYDVKFNKDKFEYNLDVDNSVELLARCLGGYTDKKMLCINDDKFNVAEGIEIAGLLNGREAYLEYSSEDDDMGYLGLGELKEGKNTFKIKLTAEDGKSQEYVFNINRLSSKESKEKKNEKVDNPNTGIKNYAGIIFLIIVLGSTIFVIVRKKSRFPKKA